MRDSSRAAIQGALADTLDRFPDADLLNLTNEQKEYAVEVFVASDIYGRLFLDLGTKVIESAPSTSAGLRPAEGDSGLCPGDGGSIIPKPSGEGRISLEGSCLSGGARGDPGDVHCV